jgi:hypothetical protein
MFLQLIVLRHERGSERRRMECSCNGTKSCSVADRLVWTIKDILDRLVWTIKDVLDHYQRGLISPGSTLFGTSVLTSTCHVESMCPREERRPFPVGILSHLAGGRERTATFLVPSFQPQKNKTHLLLSTQNGACSFLHTKTSPLCDFLHGEQAPITQVSLQQRFQL